MINPRISAGVRCTTSALVCTSCTRGVQENGIISAVWSTTKPIATFSFTPRVQEVHPRAEVVHLTPGLIAKHMINPRISAVWSSTKQIVPFSCTPRVQEVHTRAEVVHLTPGLLGLGVLFNCHS